MYTFNTFIFIPKNYLKHTLKKQGLQVCTDHNYFMTFDSVYLFLSTTIPQPEK